MGGGGSKKKKKKRKNRVRESLKKGRRYEENENTRVHIHEKYRIYPENMNITLRIINDSIKNGKCIREVRDCFEAENLYCWPPPCL